MSLYTLASFLPVSILLLTGMLLSILTKKLTLLAAVAGGIVGLCIYCGAGFTGIAMIAAFFLSGSTATSWKANSKEKLGTAEENKGQRKPGQVIANGGVAALCGVLSLLIPENAILFSVMMAASLSSATADTLSSELGTLYGKNFYNIKTLMKDKRGLDGVISFEGCMIGVAGSIIIALIYSVGYGFGNYTLYIVLAGTIGNLADSYMGATVERKNLLNNNEVNFLNTLIAAIAALGLFSLIK